MTESGVWRLEAPAKINLCLEILGRRPDGFHDIGSVLQTVSLYDTLTFTPRADREIVLHCDDPTLAADPRQNLVWRAARLLQQACQAPDGAEIRLEKRIPLAAGLGGGSSDAAAALRGLDRLWGLRLPPHELQDLAALLGSDVPFFLDGGTALAAGRGELVTALPLLGAGWFVLITPALALPDKTRVVYRLLRAPEHTDGVRTLRLATRLRARTAPPVTMLYNGLEDAAFRAFDGLAAVRAAVVAAGGESVRLTGAGPSLFVYYPAATPARELATRVAAAGLPVHVVQPVPGASPHEVFT